MDIVLGILRSYDGHAAHVHDAGTVTIETPYPPARLSQRNTQCYLRRMPHGTDREEVALMSLIHRRAVLKEFPAYHARGGYNSILFSKCGSYRPDGILPAHRKVVLLHVLKRIGIKGVFLDDQRIALLCCLHVSYSFLNLCFGLIFLLGKDGIVNAHDIE